MVHQGLCLDPDFYIILFGVKLDARREINKLCHARSRRLSFSDLWGQKIDPVDHHNVIIREMGGAPRNPAPRNHFLVWIVKPSGCHCTDAFGEKTIVDK